MEKMNLKCATGGVKMVAVTYILESFSVKEESQIVANR